MSMISFKLPSAAAGVTRTGGDSGPVVSVKNNNQLKSVQCNEYKQMDASNIKKKKKKKKKKKHFIWVSMYLARKC